MPNKPKVPTQLQGFKPYHNTSGGEPKKPPAIGRLPSGPNKRFPGVAAPTEVTPPPGGYQSIISTRPPLNEGQKRQAMRVITPFFGDVSSTAGGQSLSAFGRALTDNTRSTMQGSQSKFEQEFLQQAMKSQAEDFLSQKQNAADTYRMKTSNAIGGADIYTHYDQGTKDLLQSYWTERWNEEAERTAMWLRAIGSFL